MLVDVPNPFSERQRPPKAGFIKHSVEEQSASKFYLLIFFLYQLMVDFVQGLTVFEVLHSRVKI